MTVKRVPELMSDEQMKAASMKVDQDAPVATIDELPEYDERRSWIIVNSSAILANLKNK